MQKDSTRRAFLGTLPAAAAGLATAKALNGAPTSVEKPVLLGGKRSYSGKFPSWPIFDGNEEQAIVSALRSGNWNRVGGKNVDRFEKAYAQMMGADYCLAVNSGTSSILTSLSVLRVGAGDEVIVPAYTFVATVNPILSLQALPVFVDIDPATQQIDASKIEAAITPRTVAIIPVHLGGNVADLDAIPAIAKRKKLAVVEDACQAHLAEWRGRKAGTYGATGCFSFQASKNMTTGDGGALLTNDKALFEKAASFHSHGRSGKAFYHEQRGLNLRMTEFQGAVAAVQMSRLDAQTKTRAQNAEYLTGLLKDVPGIEPAHMYPGCTRNSYYLLLLRYRKEHFAGMPREQFLKAARAEGLPISAGYPRLNHQPFLADTFQTRGYQKVYSKQELDRWTERNITPESDRLADEGCWIIGTNFLNARTNMDQIAEALRKIQRYAGELARI